MHIKFRSGVIQCDSLLGLPEADGRQTSKVKRSCERHDCFASIATIFDKACDAIMRGC